MRISERVLIGDLRETLMILYNSVVKNKNLICCSKDRIKLIQASMEKLILHLSPVARRRTLKNNSNNVNKTSSLGRNVTRHRNKSEPNVKGSSASSRAASLKNVSV